VEKVLSVCTGGRNHKELKCGGCDEVPKIVESSIFRRRQVVRDQEIQEFCQEKTKVFVKSQREV
jgi:hypothetical protein